MILRLISCIHFAISDKAENLRDYWRVEVLRKERFSWFSLYPHSRNRRRRFLFWWRLANEMFLHGNKRQRKIAHWINNRLEDRYTTDIGLGAIIGAGLHIPHHNGIVISSRARIGKNLAIRQNTTIGAKQGMSDTAVITIGDNVDIGAHCLIIGAVTIGDNVTLGAGSFVSKDVKSNVTYITRKTSEIIERDNAA